ncbi:MAG TPA: hypothetical protein V6D28_27925 [Leptolyngbyaceae cyanobacterium]
MTSDPKQAMLDLEAAVEHLFYGPSDDLFWEVWRRENVDLEKVAAHVDNAKDAIAEVEEKLQTVQAWEK